MTTGRVCFVRPPLIIIPMDLRNTSTQRENEMNIKTIIAAAVLLSGSAKSAQVGLSTFSNEYVGVNVTASLSSATTNRFTVNYDTVAAGNSFVITSAGVSGGPVTLDIGKSAVLTFTYTGTRVSTLDLGFRWGFDFGGTAVQMRADEASAGGVYSGTFLRESFVTANGDTTNATGAVNTDFALGTEPASNYWFKTGSSNVVVTTELTRITTNSYQINVFWGSNTYSSATTTVAAIDGTVDAVYFGTGKDSGGGVAVNDNYTVSNVALEVPYEPSSARRISLICVHTP